MQLTLAQLISRATYPASELKTTRWIKENSAVCHITGYPIDKITKDKLYQNSIKLYKNKDAIEQFLSKKTNEIFDLNDKIILLDLTKSMATPATLKAAKQIALWLNLAEAKKSVAMQK